MPWQTNKYGWCSVTIYSCNASSLQKKSENETIVIKHEENPQHDSSSRVPVFGAVGRGIKGYELAFSRQQRTYWTYYLTSITPVERFQFYIAEGEHKNNVGSTRGATRKEISKIYDMTKRVSSIAGPSITTTNRQRNQNTCEIFKLVRQFRRLVHNVYMPIRFCCLDNEHFVICSIYLRCMNNACAIIVSVQRS